MKDSNPRLYLDINKAMMLLKAGAAQESTGKHTFPSEKQAEREYEHSFERQPTGEGGAETPDLPDRGRDWHGTVPGVPDEDQEPADEDDSDEPSKNGVQKVWADPTTPFVQEGSKSKEPVENQEQQASAVKSITAAAIKAFSGAPRFAQGPLVPPREKDWLLTQGYSPEEVASGQVQITSRMRGEFNRWLQGTIRKSFDSLLGR